MGGNKGDSGAPGKTAVLACSGASNVGQMAGEAAKRLHKEGAAKFFCLSSVGVGVPGVLNSLLETDRVLVIDGCPNCCGARCVDKAGLSGYSHLVLTELGIEKTNDFDWSEADMENALDVCREMLKERPTWGRDALAFDDGRDLDNPASSGAGA